MHVYFCIYKQDAKEVTFSDRPGLDFLRVVGTGAFANKVEVTPSHHTQPQPPLHPPPPVLLIRSVTNGHGQPKSGEQNGDVMEEVAQLVWMDNKEEAAKKNIRTAKHEAERALALKKETTDPAERAKIKIPPIPTYDGLAKNFNKADDKWLPPFWLAWVIYGPLGNNPDGRHLDDA